MNLFLAIVQILTLVVLVFTVFVSYRQAKTAEKAATLSLKQVQLMRAQLNASFRPVVDVTGGEYGVNSATLTLQNVGNSPALALTAICRSGYRENLGSLGAESMRRFRFDNSYNAVPAPAGPPEDRYQFRAEIQSVPLRLEYQSVSGAKCWTNIKIALGKQGPVEPEIEHGIELP